MYLFISTSIAQVGGSLLSYAISCNCSYNYAHIMYIDIYTYRKQQNVESLFTSQ